MLKLHEIIGYVSKSKESKSEAHGLKEWAGAQQYQSKPESIKCIKRVDECITTIKNTNDEGPV